MSEDIKLWPTLGAGQNIKITYRRETLEEKRERLISELLYHSGQVGRWLSAALEDRNTCVDMREDIQAFFKAIDALEIFPDDEPAT